MNRKYNPDWENEFNWLTLKDNAMFCKQSLGPAALTPGRKNYSHQPN